MNSSTILSTVDGFNEVELEFLYNQSVIEASNLWSTENITQGGDVDFCIKYTLYLGNIPVHFLETIYKIKVDLLSGFNTSFETFRTAPGDGGEDLIDYEENIAAYQCNDTFHIIESPLPVTQGDYIQICLETAEESKFEVVDVKDCTVRQNSTVSSNIMREFEYVEDFEDTLLAETVCVATNTTESKCKVKMQVIAPFFEDDDPLDLLISGIVKLDFFGVGGGGRRRQLRFGGESMDEKNVKAGIAMTNNGRNLQVEEEKEGGSSFEIIVPLSFSSTMISTQTPPTDIEKDGDTPLDINGAIGITSSSVRTGGEQSVKSLIGILASTLIAVFMLF